jgi:hypothetical protein
VTPAAAPAAPVVAHDTWRQGSQLACQEAIALGRNKEEDNVFHLGELIAVPPLGDHLTSHLRHRGGTGHHMCRGQAEPPSPSTTSLALLRDRRSSHLAAFTGLGELHASAPQPPPSRTSC